MYKVSRKRCSFQQETPPIAPSHKWWRCGRNIERNLWPWPGAPVRPGEFQVWIWYINAYNVFYDLKIMIWKVGISICECLGNGKSQGLGVQMAGANYYNVHFVVFVISIYLQHLAQLLGPSFQTQVGNCRCSTCFDARFHPGSDMDRKAMQVPCVLRKQQTGFVLGGICGKVAWANTS